MKYTEAGTYELIYTAADECGNETQQTRTVIVEATETFATVLYSDGTFIINESSNDRASNIASHGAVSNEYAPLDANNDYVFANQSDRPYNSKITSITAVEFGSTVAPTSLAYWFQNATNLTSIDWTNFDGSNVTTARALFHKTKLTTVTFPSMPNLESIQFVCNSMPNLVSADFSQVGATGITNTTDAFQGCYALTTVDFSGLAGTVVSAERTFANASGGGNMAIKTVYASADLDFSSASASNMFRMCVNIEGGAGTRFDPNYVNNAYARIDGGSTAPGYFTAK